MKKLIIISMGTMLSYFSHSQDLIILRNGEEIESKVTEVGTDEISYKKYSNLSGPSYGIKKSQVFMIRYENGSKDVFPEVADSGNTLKEGNPLPKSSFNVNPLGLLQFGPILQLEQQVSENTYLVPYFRYAYAGVLTHLLWTEFYSESALSPGSAALGLGVKSFADLSGNTWYYGSFLDFSWTKANYGIGYEYETEEKSINLAVVPNVGYRWRSSKGTYVNVGLFSGVAFTLKNEETYVIDGSPYDYSDDGETTFFAMLELSFGWEK